MCVQVFVELRVFSSSGVGVVGVCEPPDVGTGDRTQSPLHVFFMDGPFL